MRGRRRQCGSGAKKNARSRRSRSARSGACDHRRFAVGRRRSGRRATRRGCSAGSAHQPGSAVGLANPRTPRRGWRTPFRQPEVPLARSLARPTARSLTHSAPNGAQRRFPLWRLSRVPNPAHGGRRMQRRTDGRPGTRGGSGGPGRHRQRRRLKGTLAHEAFEHSGSLGPRSMLFAQSGRQRPRDGGRVRSTTPR